MTMLYLTATVVFSNLVVENANFFLIPNLRTCAFLCLRNSTCSSFFYQSDTHQCHHEDRVYTASLTAKELQGIKYYEWKHGSCRQDFTYNRAVKWCYKHLGARSLTLADSSHACHMMNATLIKIDTKEKNDIVLSYSKKFGHIWTGGERRNRYSNFRWADGSSLTFTDWYPGQPKYLLIVIFVKEDRTAWHAGLLGQVYTTMCEQAI